MISNTTFGHIYDFREIINYLVNETNCILNSLGADFGDNYEDDSQQQVASYYLYWLKMAIHYKELFAQSIKSSPTGLPETEVDKTTKKQAAQFQAFFAIRLNAVDAEINDQIASLKRDLVDNCEIFYNRFISPSLRISKDISNPLEFDFLTTRFSKDNPMLSGELVVATNLIKGNFASIHADCMQRFEMMSARVDSMMSLIHEKRKYANYISQLGNKSVQKRQVLQTVQNDLYSPLFRNIYSNTNRNNTFLSSHSKLDGLLDNDHPQYLLRDNGNITGHITAERGATIDGVDLSEHAHTGSDGSHRIKSTDIDYDNIRIQKYSDGNNFLHSHNATIWNREYLIEHLSEGEDPWVNEVEGSKRMSSKQHNHYHYNIHWYSQPGVCEMGEFSRDFYTLAPIFDDRMEHKLTYNF